MNGSLDIKSIQQPREVEFKSLQPDLRTGENRNSFSDMLIRAMDSVDQTMKTSEKGIQDFAAGKTDNVHDIMINMQRAQISFQLMVEVRNKAIEAYQEISRMQI